MTDAQARPHWARLGAELRRLRMVTGETQRKIAKAVGSSQATVDRWEHGGPEGKPPSWTKVAAWAVACAGASPDLALLRALTESALNEHALFRNLLKNGLAIHQEDMRAEEAVAMTIRNFNPWGVPGLLQTADYARHIMLVADPRRRHAGDVDEAVQVRMRRREILDDPERHVEFTLIEQSLRTLPCPVEVLAAQLGHLAAVISSLPPEAFGVIPTGVRVHALPQYGFILFEDRTDGENPFVAIELGHKREVATEPDDVDFYRAQYSLLRRSAIFGDEAVALVRQVAESLS